MTACGARTGCALLASAWLLLGAAAVADPVAMWAARGATHELYLLGSIHFLRPDRDPLPPAVLAAYRTAEVLVMELDIDDIDQASSQQTVQRLGKDPAGRTLDVLLGQEAYARALARARILGVNLEQLRGFEPWLAALMVTQAQLNALGFNAASGVEQQLATMAVRDRKEIRGLETLDDQLAAMDTLPPETQREFLLQTLEESADMASEVELVVAAWKRGDTLALEERFLDDLREQPEVYRRVVVERNRKWARQLEPLLRDRRRHLVVVGTLHLVGPDSLVAMLRDAGYVVRQVDGAVVSAAAH